MDKFNIGDDIYVRDPRRFVSECSCIVGPVTGITGSEGDLTYRIAASVGRLPTSGGCYDAEMEFAGKDMAHRIGTPISQLSGRPGHPGYERFVEIGRSWGYP